jgi:hypothetical protein
MPAQITRQNQVPFALDVYPVLDTYISGILCHDAEKAFFSVSKTPEPEPSASDERAGNRAHPHVEPPLSASSENIYGPSIHGDTLSDK